MPTALGIDNEWFFYRYVVPDGTRDLDGQRDLVRRWKRRLYKVDRSSRSATQAIFSATTIPVREGIAVETKHDGNQSPVGTT